MLCRQQRPRILKEDPEITGPVARYLYASIDQDDTNWTVSLRDEFLELDGNISRLVLSR